MVCPECHKEALRKVYLPVGIVFKGSGFYATDNRSPSGQESRGKEDATGNGVESVGSESKPKDKKSKKAKTKSKE
jgi:predicted nucleic acid-binding Zn ribbon protein